MKALAGHDVTVEINKDKKPGKGNFIVTLITKGGDDSEGNNSKEILSLTGMKRPFADLKKLDMGDIVEEVLKALEEK